MGLAKNIVVSVCVLLSLAPSFAQSGTGQSKTDEQAAQDCVTHGWLLTEHSTDPGQEWRTYSQVLIITRNGRIVRRFTTGGTYYDWTFWAGSKQIALEEGGEHGPSVCKLFDLKVKKPLAVIEGCNDGRKNKPAWARAVLDREEKPP